MGNIQFNGETYGANDVITATISRPSNTDSFTISTWNTCKLYKVGRIAIISLDCSFSSLAQSASVYTLFELPEEFIPYAQMMEVTEGHEGIPTLIVVGSSVTGINTFSLRPISGTSSGYYRINFPYITAK